MAKRIREKAAARIENKDQRPYATAKYVRMGSSKAKRVIDLVVGKPYAVAVALLEQTPSTASDAVIKVLNSAVANATNNLGMKLEDLKVSECFINPGQVLKRSKIGSRSHVDRRDKRTSHITVKVSDGKEA